MVRTIVKAEENQIHLDVPKEYVGKDIEVTFFALEELGSTPKKTMADFWGIISNETAEELHRQVEKSRNEWQQDI